MFGWWEDEELDEDEDDEDDEEVAEDEEDEDELYNEEEDVEMEREEGVEMGEEEKWKVKEPLGWREEKEGKGGVKEKGGKRLVEAFVGLGLEWPQEKGEEGSKREKTKFLTNNCENISCWDFERKDEEAIEDEEAIGDEEVEEKVEEEGVERRKRMRFWKEWRVCFLFWNWKIKLKNFLKWKESKRDKREERIVGERPQNNSNNFTFKFWSISSLSFK